jgi:hypothetical protein
MSARYHPSIMADHPNSRIDRRRFIQRTGASLATALAAPKLHAESDSQAAASRQPSLIRQENQREGARDWQLTRIHIDSKSGYRSPRIEGYCSRQSVQAGDRLDIMVSTRPAARFQVEIFRTGYYGGRGARLMSVLGPFQGREQPDPPVGENRLRECRWEPSATVLIPVDWPSGVYLGRLSTLPPARSQPYWQSYAIFIVRDERPADILFQCSDNTWLAYNRWPDRFSLYDDGSGRDWSSPHDVRVSFDRPYGKYRQIYDNPQSVGSGEYLCFEFPLAYWLEQHGFDVTYCSNSDLLGPERARKCKTFLSVGHDEYWDLRQYESVKSLIESGVNALFLSGNSVCWVSPFVAARDGRPNRIISRAGPYGGAAKQRQERVDGGYPMTGPDEGLLMGVRNVEPVNGGGDWTITRPDHWMFEGTGMKRGDSIPGLVGWEYHGNPADIPGLQVVAEGTAWVGGTRPQQWAASIHPGPKNNFVFNAATIFWAQGMSNPPGHMLPWSHASRPHGPDERVQRITENLLRRALA